MWFFGIKIFLNRLSRKKSWVKLPKPWRRRLGFPLREGILREFKWMMISGSRQASEGDHVGRTISPTTSLRIVGCSSVRNLWTSAFTAVSWHNDNGNGTSVQITRRFWVRVLKKKGWPNTHRFSSYEPHHTFHEHEQLSIRDIVLHLQEHWYNATT